MEDRIGSGSVYTGPVYTGENKITVNDDVMARIVLDWLHANHSGGPYRVTKVEELSGNNYGPSRFEITFTDEPKQEPK